ncbi:High-affnity carbon uptake protein Hat/HatR [Cystobacter fuscus DSM 2262]|uniref:High-affnity carbon uptake protein Hat/HatR n=1 Tax=Cystobacter fuscus (strain ATCC 25194 / DSM 2262 / NBRC 100088 / M29) TaxID=1242864 RepID=S9QPK8_CYSF2|nr:caspase family protein [Cystobacter fuscus]EPX63244.1 High-affnity carbon uptake protein Hat/HatR [Cystobacter fuscus DSM 2262]
MGHPDSESSPPGFARSLAIVIGIDDYAHGIPPLLNAVRDAHTVAETLRLQGFEILRLLDAEASLASLTHLFSHQLPSLQPPPDRLLIYFAGHGLAHTDPRLHLAGYLLPSDARRDEPSSYWPMAALHEALRQLPCGHLLLILDCCFAGAFPHSFSRDIRAPSPSAPLFLERFRHFSSRRSFQLLLSTAHDELASDRLLAKPSQESLGDGLHSPFALAFLEAIRSPSPADTNRDGLLTSTELYTFLRDRLLQQLPPHASQTPALWNLDWHDGGEFLFLLADTFPALPPAAPLSQHANPYLGLRPFASAHRHLFFGRERLVDTLLTRLRSQALLLLCGPSGAGKSSIVHAGLLPRLGENGSWYTPPSLRPSAQPLQALSSWLAALAPDVTSPSADDLSTQPHRAADLLRAWLLRDPLRSVVLVVDPLEELVTACLDDSARLAFLRALSCLLQLSHPRLHLLLLLRSDFEPHFISRLLPTGLSPERWHDGRFQLPLMNRDELRRCIEKPAETCVLFFDAGLIERLLDDVEQMPGALPLLSVALSELFDAYLVSGRDDRTLSFEDYRQMGGIAGALQRRAELIFHGTVPSTAEADMSSPPMSPWELPAFQRTLHNVLLRMVSPEGGELARRRVPRAELEYPLPEENSRVQRVLHTLETCRLVVASDEEGPCVEPAHDALLSSWPRLHDWARHAQRELLLLRRVSHAAAEWHRHHQSHDFLWADARLDQLGLPPGLPRGAGRLLALPVVPPGGTSTELLDFNAAESGFLHASARRRRALRTLRSTLVLTVATLLVTLTVAALFQADRATNNAREAQRQQRIAEDNARESLRQKNLALLSAQIPHARSLLPTDPTRAMLVLLAMNTRKEFPDSEWMQTALDTSQHAISSAILTGHSAEIYSARFSADGTRVLTASADGTARLWRADGTGTPIVFSANEESVNSAVFSPDESHILTASDDGIVRLWRADDARTPVRVWRHGDSVESAVFSSDGSRILSASTEGMDGTARLWRIDGTGQPVVFRGHFYGADSASFSPDERHILTRAGDHTAYLWNANGVGPPLILKGNSKIATFSPDGSSILTASAQGDAHLWRINGSLKSRFKAQEDKVNFATFSPDGAYVLTASDDGTAHRYLVGNSEEPDILDGHTSAVNFAAFSPDGAYVLTASDDSTARLRRADGTGTSIIFLGHTRPVKIATFSPNGTQVLTASDDGTARLWRIHGDPPPPFFDVETNSWPAATPSPDGSLIVIATNNTAEIWRIEDKKRLAVLPDHKALVNSAVFSPDGTQLLTASDDGSARLWRTDGTGTPLVFQHSRQALTSAIFSPDGTHILTVSSSTARLWRANGEATSFVFPSPGEDHPPAIFSPDGTHVLIISEDNVVRLWPTSRSGSPVVFSGHQGQVNSAVFSPDGSRILIASTNRTARIWRVHEPDKSIVLPGHTGEVNSAVFSSDGSRVLTASDDRTAILWRADTGGELDRYPGHLREVFSADFSPDGTRIITTSGDGTARLWPIDKQTTPLIFNNDSTPGALLMRNGTRLVTFSNDMFRVWPLDPDTLTEELQKMTTVCLTAPEREQNLLETPTQAQEEYERCERSHGRLP